MHHLAIYGSHDSSVCFKANENEYRVYEIERLIGKRYCNLATEPDSVFTSVMHTIKQLIANDYGNIQYGSLYYAQISAERIQILIQIFDFVHVEEMSHHIGHAAGGLYQSPFNEALIISSDSGGHEINEGISTFAIFKANKTTNQIVKLANLPLDVCGAYTLMAVPISQINKQDVYSKYLSYAGKIMGLAAYGFIEKNWIQAFTEFYLKPVSLENLALLGNQIGLDFSAINTINNDISCSIAATSQFVFNRITTNAIMPFILKYQLPVIMVGGGALNVLYNQQLLQLLKPYNLPLFIPVNPNDCGLTFGFMALRNPPDNENKQVNIAYNGVGLLDKHKLPIYINQTNAVQTDYKQLARLLADGKIIGIVIGNSECGPRALGNRSIVCFPGFANMKKTLNNKIKFREFFRPFAPVIKEEQIHLFCDNLTESAFMSYAPTIKEIVAEKIPAAIHADGTARLQTVNQAQHPFLYNLIDAIETITGVGCLINTSFNTKGKPILTTIEDALEVLDNTELDYVYINGYLFNKNYVTSNSTTI